MYNKGVNESSMHLTTPGTMLNLIT